MKLTQLTCPHCEVPLRSLAGVRAGRRITCPNCRTPFVASTPGPDQKALPPDDQGPEEPDGAPGNKKKVKKGKRKAARGALPPGLIAGGVLTLLLAGVLLLLGSGGVLIYLISQNGTFKLPGLSDGDPPIPSSLPAGWEEIRSEPGRFRAAMPVPVVERTRTMSSAAGPVQDHQYLYETTGENLGFSITYADFSEAQLQTKSLDQIIDSGGEAVANTYRGQVEADRKIERQGRRGREFVIQVPGRGRLLLHYYISGPRLYTLTVAGLKAALDAPEARVFFDSFRFLDAKP